MCFALYVMVAGVRARSLRDVAVKRLVAGGAAVGLAMHWWVVGVPVFDAYVFVSMVLSAGASTGSPLLARQVDRLSAPVSPPQLPTARLSLS